MRYLLIFSTALLLAQRHEIPRLNSCISEFYDPEMYNYLTFKNNCAQSLTVVLVAKDGSGAGERWNCVRVEKIPSAVTMRRAKSRSRGALSFMCARPETFPWTITTRR